MCCYFMFYKTVWKLSITLDSTVKSSEAEKTDGIEVTLLKVYVSPLVVHFSCNTVLNANTL